LAKLHSLRVRQNMVNYFLPILPKGRFKIIGSWISYYPGGICGFIEFLIHKKLEVHTMSEEKNKPDFSPMALNETLQ
jgi:hypothetical protein